MVDSKSGPKRPIDVLTRKNYDMWFRKMEVFLIGEDLWPTVDLANTPTISTSVSIPSSSTSKITQVLEPESYGKNLGLGFRSVLNDRRRMDTKARYYILNCIDDKDREILMGDIRARGIWISLNKKYKKSL